MLKISKILRSIKPNKINYTTTIMTITIMIAIKINNKKTNNNNSFTSKYKINLNLATNNPIKNLQSINSSRHF